MTEQELTRKARDHWAKWLPAKTAELKASGMLLETTQAAGKLAAQTVQELMSRGYQEHEAMEVALAKYVLLQPEADASSPDWERAELAQMEREYRQKMGG